MLAMQTKALTTSLRPGDQLLVPVTYGTGEVFVIEQVVNLTEHVARIDGMLHLVDVHGTLLSSISTHRFAGLNAEHVVTRLIEP